MRSSSSRNLVAGSCLALVAWVAVARRSALSRPLADLRRKAARRRRVHAELAVERQRTRVTLQSIADGVIRTDGRAHVTDLNPMAEALTGWSAEEAAGKPLAEVLRTFDEVTGDSVADLIEACLRDGRRCSSNHTVLASRSRREKGEDDFVAELSVAPVHAGDGRMAGAVVAFRDVSHQRDLAEQLSYQATHDALTGLCNRLEFERRVGQAIETAQAEGVRHVLCYLDLDQFKVVNDTSGHMAGDELLKELAVVLGSEVRDSDTLARLGGDEFGVLLERCPADEGLIVAEKLRRAVDAFSFSYRDRVFSVGVSIGVVPLTPGSGTLADALSAADAACYAAKENGRNRIQLYHSDDVTLARQHGEMQWVARINAALAANRFCLHSQPIASVRPSEGEVRHQEILVRMLDEDGQLVPPGAFIPAAERFGLMQAVDRWVVARALETIASRMAAAPDGALGVYSINLSGASLGDYASLEFIGERFAEQAVPGDAVCFEVTETAAVTQLGSAIEFMQELKALGCRFSLDDFGKGVSSFAYLKSLPVDFVKIDGAFVKDMVRDPVDAAMVEAITRVGHVMGIQTIAEFVEDEETLERLREIGVDYAQGFGIARPGPFLQARAGDGPGPREESPRAGTIARAPVRWAARHRPAP